FPCQCMSEEAKPAVQPPAERATEVHPPAPADAAVNPPSPATENERSFITRGRRVSTDSAESQPVNDSKACAAGPCEPAAEAKPTVDQVDSSPHKSSATVEKLPAATGASGVVSKWGSTTTASATPSPDATTAKAERQPAAPAASLNAPEV